MTDRHEQARAEAERRVATKRERLWDTEGEHLSHSWGEGFQAGFREAAEWADANPQPHTITRAELAEAAEKVSERFGGIQSPGALRILFAVALADLGIEVEDSDE